MDKDFSKNINKDELNQLNKDVKYLLKKFNETQNNNTENDFYEENKDKNIVLIMENEEEHTGKLIDIDKFRIILENDGKPWHIFKHSVVAYYIPE